MKITTNNVKALFISLCMIMSLNLFAQNDYPHVVLETTQGKILLELYPKVAPLAVENFITHVEEGYYNGIAFHRIIKNFMIQGGDPTETGRGGKSIWGKPFKDEYKGKLFDTTGVLAMANAGPSTNGSQFFITTAPTPWLNGHHTIFGHAASDPESMKTLEKLNNTATNGRRGGDRPIQRQEIIKAYVQQQNKAVNVY